MNSTQTNPTHRTMNSTDTRTNPINLSSKYTYKLNHNNTQTDPHTTKYTNTHNTQQNRIEKIRFFNQPTTQIHITLNKIILKQILYINKKNTPILKHNMTITSKLIKLNLQQ